MSKLQGKPSNLYIAATYLLCADKKLWDYARYTVGAQSIDFNQLEHISLSPHGYTLFRIAQDIYTGTTHIKINELCNRYVVTDDILQLSEAAVNIGRGVTIK